MTRPTPTMHSAVTPSADYQNALDYLYSRINYEKIGLSGASQYRFRLRRMAELLKRLNLNHFLHQESTADKPAIVHIAGTKGKGSTASLVASACTQAGYRTGLYTSPHLQRLEERFLIDGQTCTDSQFVRLVKQVQNAAESLEQEHGTSTFFEMTTAMAILHFANNDCQVVIAEVGLGGRLDSTNVLDPTVSVITSIGLDHQNVLGSDLVSIAREKAGIIKPNIPVISGVEQEEALQVVRESCENNDAPWYQLGTDFSYASAALPNWGSKIHFSGSNPKLPEKATYHLAMEGEHQAKNATVAAATLFLLEQQIQLREQPASVNDPKGISIDAIDQGFSNLQVPGRMERFDLKDHVVAIVDSSHNEDSIQALADSLRRRNHDQKYVIVFGTSQDKDAETMLAILRGIPGKLILTQYHSNPRYLAAEKLWKLLPEKEKSNASMFDQPLEACEEAFRCAKQDHAIIVVCGSFFLAAETRPWILHKL